MRKHPGLRLVLGGYGPPPADDHGEDDVVTIGEHRRTRARGYRIRCGMALRTDLNVGSMLRYHPWTCL